ncbi:HMCN1 [Branchiostoma lanceolatum]|uniref:HMCN1 protein n=1 Tax=Branchiostoma lanceolatum TaxID=7740 RepID=A0A8S4MMY6_BRALA|nr:HMCN1 [Branchiostoma lanceolatum]
MGGEAIQSGNIRLISQRDALLGVLAGDQPSYEVAREMIGVYLHILQDFYSNTNWVELNGAVPYEDLEIGPVRNTRNSGEMINWLNGLSVSGGGDCPEYCFSGLELALRQCLPESRVYVFTDADPKDPEKYASVVSLISGGSVYEGDKDEIDELTEVINVAVSNSAPVVLTKATLSPGNGRVVSIQIDSTLQEFVISLVGSNTTPRVTVETPTGSIQGFGTADAEISVNVGNNRVYRLRNPQPGTWKMRFIGVNTSIITEVLGSENIRALNRLSLVNEAGQELITATLSVSGSGGMSNALVVRMTVEPRIVVVSTLPNPTLPYPTLPYPTLPYLPYPTLPYPTLPYPTLPYPTLPYPTLPYPTPPDPTPPHPILPYLPTLPYPTLPYPTLPYLPYPTLPYPTTPHPTPPHPTPPHPTPPHPTLPYPTLPHPTHPTLPYPTLPYPTRPYPTLPYPTLPDPNTTQHNTVDTVDPTCTIRNATGNCTLEQQHPSSCHNHQWSLDVHVRDDESGVYSLTASPGGNGTSFTHDNFTPGATGTTITAKYNSNCCKPSGSITVSDKSGNAARCAADYYIPTTPPPPTTPSQSTTPIPSTKSVETTIQPTSEPTTEELSSTLQQATTNSPTTDSSFSTMESTTPAIQGTSDGAGDLLSTTAVALVAGGTVVAAAVTAISTVYFCKRKPSVKPYEVQY